LTGFTQNIRLPELGALWRGVFPSQILKGPAPTKGEVQNAKKTIRVTPAVMTLHWSLMIIWLVPVSLTGAVPLEITDWSSTGGTTRNKTNQKDEMYLVEPGNKIIFKVEAENVRNYEWQVNKVVQASAMGDSLNWTVPDEKGIWEIHLKATSSDDEAHQEWVVSTLSKSEAPDFFEYFTDGKWKDRTETDPWARPLPEWKKNDKRKGQVEEGIGVVFLPAGQYVFRKEVSVPGGLALLGEGAKTLCRTKGMDTHIFHVEGDQVRFTRLKLVDADESPNKDNNTYGISVSGKRNVRVDHCEILGFSRATSFVGKATAQVDHCFIHHNLRVGQGYGVALLSGAYVLVTDNEFSQNRHSIATNGALDWSSPKRLGKYIHKTGVRKTHWEFVHNRVGSNDKALYEHSAVDTHPGMDGTFVVEGNVFENLRHGIGIRDGSGLIRGNVFRNLRSITGFRTLVAISIAYGTHNNIPVEGCMPHDIKVEDNVFLTQDAKYETYSIGKAENIIINGRLVAKTKVRRPAPGPLPLLMPMDVEGKLGIGRRKPVAKPSAKTKVPLNGGTENP
jgi:parallel beta helix pectate lyase-like protein